MVMSSLRTLDSACRPYRSAGCREVITAGRSSARSGPAGARRVLAVDPSSPFSGGPCWEIGFGWEHALDPTSTSGRWRRGVTWAISPPTLRRCEPSCWWFRHRDRRVIGVGQSGSRWRRPRIRCWFCWPLAGGWDQAAKAGILEIGDIFVVNKSDREARKPWCGEIEP
jgi:hypothetical protein